MNKQSKAELKTAGHSLRSNHRKIVNVFVSEGSFSDPFYNFKDKQGRTIETFKLNPNKKYRFKRADSASSHPFYISDQGFKQPATNRIKVKGDGTFDSGITGKEQFTLSIKKKHRQEFMSSGELFFYCTSHSSMIGQFRFKKNRKSALSRIPEPSLSPTESALDVDAINKMTSTMQIEPHPFGSENAWQPQSVFTNQSLSTSLSHQIQ